jgi:hypothetical protein
MTARHSAARIRIGACVAALVVLVSCGGGDVGSGGTGAAPYGVALGTVNGFGSVIVDGIRFDDRYALAVAETEPGKDVPAEVRLGHRVAVGFDQSDTAKSLRVEAALVGPVASVGATGRFVALGQTVVINDDPVAGPVTQLGGGYLMASDVQAGDVVEVHGLLIPQGSGWLIQATRIERESALPAYLKVTGVVSQLGAGASRFNLGALAVDAGTANVLPAGRSLANDQVVAVFGQAGTLSGSGGAPTLVASQVRIKSLPASGDQAYLSGSIAGLDATARTFFIGALKVDYAAAVLTPSTAILASGRYVRVFGVVGADGTLAAVTVTVRDGSSESEAELQGTITGFNAATQTFTVRDVAVDASRASLEGCPASGLADGVFAEIHGSLNNTTVIAEQVQCESEPAGGIVEREGTAGSVDPSAMTFVLTDQGKSQVISWSAQTFFRNVTPATLSGKKVNVEGVLVNGALNASKVKLDD